MGRARSPGDKRAFLPAVGAAGSTAAVDLIDAFGTAAVRGGGYGQATVGGWFAAGGGEGLVGMKLAFGGTVSAQNEKRGGEHKAKEEEGDEGDEEVGHGGG